MTRIALALLAACHASTTTPAPKQLVTAVVDDWQSTHATMRLWQREHGAWQPVGEAWPAVVGVHGVARLGDKHEGDGKSPAGRFTLRAAYGYAAAPPAGTKLPYTPTDASWQCVDDPRSRYYARVLDRRTVTPDWKSAEDMRRDDELYTWVIDTAYNAAQAPAGGSCIFLHVWSGPDSATVGCTAMPEPQLAHLLSELEPGTEYVLLPRDEYRAVAEAWGLPPQ